MINRKPKGAREGGRFASDDSGKHNIPTVSLNSQPLVSLDSKPLVSLNSIPQVSLESHGLAPETHNDTIDENYAKFKDHIKVFRGLEDVTSAGEITFNKMGVHWSSNPTTALEMAVPAWATEEDEIDSVEGTIIYGLVHPDHIMKQGTPEMEGSESWRMPEDHWEAEQTVRLGSPIYIVKVETVSHDNRTGVATTVVLQDGIPEEGLA